MRRGRGDDLEGARVLFPLGFCRECGQEHNLVSRTPWDGQERLLPRSPLLRYDDEDVPGEPGYLSIEHDELWHEDEDLPDNWLEWRKSGPRVKKNYDVHVPQRLRVSGDGVIGGGDGAIEGWWQPAPLMMCLRCRPHMTSGKRATSGSWSP